MDRDIIAACNRALHWLEMATETFFVVYCDEVSFRIMDPDVDSLRLALITTREEAKKRLVGVGQDSE